MFFAIFVASLVLAIIIHELGHFATAKAFGMKAERFFVGFGPTLWSVRRGETEYGLKAIPAGGFVKIAGMSAYEEAEPGDAERGRLFYQQPAWQRLVVLVAGSATHFVIAFVLLVAALALVGLPTEEATNRVFQTLDEAPAAEAGLEPGDAIVAIDGEPTPDFEAVSAAVAERGGEQAVLTVVRADEQREEVTVTIAPRAPDGREVGFLGIVPEPVTAPLPAGEALREAAVGDFSVPRLTQLTVVGLGQALTPDSLGRWLGQLGAEDERDPEGLISIVGATQVAGTIGEMGDLFAFLAIIAQINIVLGFLNMLPLPPLDGGHVAVLVVEQAGTALRRLRGKPGRYTVDPQVLTPIALVVIAVLGTVALTAIVIDVVRPASEILQ